MKTCQCCGKEFNRVVIIEGTLRNLQKRKYCLDCSPFGEHNTVTLKTRKRSNYKVCTKCGEEKLEESFARKNATRRCSWCRSCLYDHQKIKWKEKRLESLMQKGGKCQKCGYDKCIGALEFHHIDPSNKKYSWDKMRGISKESLKNELDKCILLCANCHRELHSEQHESK